MTTKNSTLTTTLNEIKSQGPCKGSWKKLLRALDKTEADDEPLTLRQIYDANGVDDALWALNCFTYRDCHSYLLEIVEKNLKLLEKVVGLPRYKVLLQPLKKLPGHMERFYKGEISGADFNCVFTRVLELRKKLSHFKELESPINLVLLSLENVGSPSKVYSCTDWYADAVTWECCVTQGTTHENVLEFDELIDKAWEEIDHLFVKHFFILKHFTLNVYLYILILN